MSHKEGSGEVVQPGDKPALLLVHGSWSGAWVYDFLRPELEKRGYPVEVVDLPIQEKEPTYRDFGEIALKAMQKADHDRWIGVGHSSGANTLLWLEHLAQEQAIGKVALEKLIYIAPSPVGAMLGRPSTRENKVPDQYGLIAHSAGLDRTGGTEPITYDRELAQLAFFNDCSSHTADWALDRLSPQFRYRAFSELPQLPRTPAYCLSCGTDWVLRPAWQKYVADKWLNVKHTHSLEYSGHFPMISWPEETARWIDIFASEPI